MARSRVSAGIDIGSNQIVCVLCESEGEGRPIKILSGAVRKCPTVSGGEVRAIAETARVIRELIEACEQEADAEADSVIVGVRGTHIYSLHGHGTFEIRREDKEITADDIKTAIDNASATPREAGRSILHVIPQIFWVDKSRSFNPEGMDGSWLEVDVNIVTASASSITNIEKTISRAGFEISEKVCSTVALGAAVLTPEEKDLGCILIDFGGGTTSISVYYEGCIKFLKEIEYGSELITLDLATALSTFRDVARSVKEKHGFASTSFQDEEEISYPGMDRTTMQQVRSADLLSYIQPRVEEILEQTLEAYRQSKYEDMIGHAVLTGGGSQLRGLRETVVKYFGIKDCRLGGIQRDLVVCEKEFLNPVYTTAISLVYFPSVKYAGGDSSDAEGSSSLTSRVKRTFKGLFGKEIF